MLILADVSSKIFDHKGGINNGGYCHTIVGYTGGQTKDNLLASVHMYALAVNKGVTLAFDSV